MRETRLRLTWANLRVPRDAKSAFSTSVYERDGDPIPNLKLSYTSSNFEDGSRKFMPRDVWQFNV